MLLKIIIFSRATISSVLYKDENQFILYNLNYPLSHKKEFCIFFLEKDIFLYEKTIIRN